MEGLLERIKKAGKGENGKRLFYGLNRVALGSVIFGPRVDEKERDEILENHNEELLKQAEGSRYSSRTDWNTEVSKLLEEIKDDKLGIGPTLLGLTTKTAQEISMSSESDKLDFSLSLLYSILYVPLLYFHDAKEELESGEVTFSERLNNFNVNYEFIKVWLQKAHNLCAKAPQDQRKKLRLMQLKMAFDCFSKKLPESVRTALEGIYDPSKQGVPAQKP